MMSREEFIRDIGSLNRYILLSRMESDCKYYLDHETKCPPEYNHLWANHDPAAQIAYMKYLWESFPEGEKPEWISLEEIEDYERRMIPGKPFPA